MANTVLAKMAVVIDAQTAAFNKSLKDTNSRLDSFTGNIKKIAGTLGIAFGVKQVASFALEVSKLAGEADGVEAAFRKLPNSTQLMEDLKNATGETVSELDLMKRSVQAANFGISLKALPDLLEFAAVRAQQTGQSVDYLVDSIVTGIGRKSPLILDNLGISAVALKDELGGVSVAAADVGQVAEAVGRIASKNLEQMGSLTKTNATQMQQFTAVWDDFQVAIGRALNGTGLLANSLGFIVDLLKSLRRAVDDINKESLLSEEKINAQVAAFQKLNEESQKIKLDLYQRALDNAKFKLEDLNTFVNAFNQGLKETNNNISKSLSRANEASGLNIDESGIAKAVKDIDVYANRIREIEALLARINSTSPTESLESSIGIVQALKDQIKLLGEQIDSSTSLGGIRELQKELEITQSRLDSILKPPGEIPKIKFDIEVPNTEDTIKEIQDSLNNSNLTVDIQLDFDPEEAFTSDQEQAIVDRVHRVQEAFSALGDFLKQSIITGIADFAEALGQAAAGNEDFGKTILKSIASFAKQFGTLLIAAGLAKISFDNLASSGYGAVIAGAALVAAAGAVSSFLDNGSSSKKTPSSAAKSQTATSVRYSNNLELTGEIQVVASGQNLVGVINEQNFKNNRTTRG